MITPLPPAPLRSQPESFASDAEIFLSALAPFATEANALQSDVNAKQTTASAAATSAIAAQAAAEAASNASIWVSGTTYVVGAVRFSPITFKSYRRKTAGAGTTDPSADSTNWQLLTSLGDVDLSSTQTITGAKTFTSTIAGNISGSAASLATARTIGGVSFNGTANINLPGVNTEGNQNTTGTAATVGTITTLQVLNATSTLSLGAIGSYAFCKTTAAITANGTIAGSSLTYSGTAGASTGGPIGTWRCLGVATTGDTTLFLRIS